MFSKWMKILILYWSSSELNQNYGMVPSWGEHKTKKHDVFSEKICWLMHWNAKKGSEMLSKKVKMQM